MGPSVTGLERADAVKPSLIDRLRDDEIASIRSEVAAGRRDHILKSLDERGRAQELVRQQYSGRYPFELLQNANDAALAMNTPGRAHFLLTDTALIVADDGSGFGREQLEAICSLGRSSKGPGTAIGHKGLGFKSVGEVTESPQILSAGIGFTFNEARLRAEITELVGALDSRQRFPLYAFPFHVTVEDFAADSDVATRLLDEGFTTVIRLPLRADVERGTVADHLVTHLSPTLLLFLNGVNQLELVGTHGDFRAEVLREEEGAAEFAILEVDDSDEQWLIYRGSVPPDEEHLALLGEAWKEVEAVNYAIAVPLDDEGQPWLEESWPLHVYFPTDETPGLKVAVHAEWALSMDRRHISATAAAQPFNARLTAEVARFAAEVVAVDLLHRFEASPEAVVALCPTAADPSAGASRQLRSDWVAALAGTAFVPDAVGTPRCPEEFALLPSSLPDKSAAHRYADLDADHTMRVDLEAYPDVRALIQRTNAASEMSVAGLLSRLRAPSRDGLEGYYEFLMSWRDAAPGHLLQSLKAAPCVLVTSGEVVAPSAAPVFLPRQQRETLIPDSLPVPIAVVPELEGVEQFLRDLGVNRFEWQDLISRYLIGILEDPDVDSSLYDSAMDGLRAYQQVRLSGNEALVPILARVLLPTRSADGLAVGRRAAGGTYFGADWTNSPDLEVLYGPFGEVEFLAVDPPSDPSQRERDRDFYRMLGVLDHPRISTAVAESNRYVTESWRHPHRGSAFNDWMAAPETVVAAHCQDGHPQSQQLRLSHRLDRHESIIESGDPRRLQALWHQLARHWGAVYSPAMTAEFRCVHSSHSFAPLRPCESLFARTLRTSQWIPVVRHGTTDLARPHEAWLFLRPVGRLRDRVPSISDDMARDRGARALADALEIVDADRPSIDSLVALLQEMADEAAAGAPIDREAQQAARWVQRTLNDVLTVDDAPHPTPETVPVLARHAGQYVFVAQPPYADDPLLKETWESELPVLNAESGLTRLTRFLSLTSLDDVVRKIAVPYGTHVGDPVEVAAAAHIRTVKPYLLALVTNDSSRAQSATQSALKRLELVVCDELVLRYQYLDTEIERTDAVCFIDVRNDGTDRRPRYTATAYLEIDEANDQPHWFPLGRLLAQHVEVPPLADAFTMLLTASQEDRLRLLADRGITSEDVDHARKRLDLPADDEYVTLLPDAYDLLPQGREIHDSSAPVPRSDEGQVGDISTAARGDGSTEVAGPTTRPAPRLDTPIDPRSVSIETGKLSEPADVSRQSGHSAGPRGGRSVAPTVESDVDRRAVGRLGEALVFEKERERLSASGRDPDSVTWVSRVDELSPYDIDSIDENNQRMYIEVKSTRDPDPSTPFFMSQAEILMALDKRAHYWIYRVSGVGTETVRCVTVQDPITAILDGRGRLLLDKAHVTFRFEVD